MSTFAPYTQANRPMKVETQLGEDVLLLNGYTGLEAISEPFSFQLDLVSIDPNINPQDVLRTPVVVSVNLPGGAQRKIHGLASRLTQLGRRDDLIFYRAEIVPWFWFLTLSRNCRIFQELSVPDILEQVFKELGYSDFEMRLSQSYSPRLYCVQYRETDFNFVSRLMEEEGIFYYFEHTDAKHTMVIADTPQYTPCKAADEVRYATDPSHMEESITEWEHEYSLQPGKVTLWDHDFEQPSLKLEATIGDEPEEIYDYHPGSFTSPSDGERLAKLLLEAEEAERNVVRGESNVRGFLPGFKFNLQDHFRRDANGEYVLTQVQHTARAGEYRGWDNEAAVDYHNTFVCIPASIPYHPPRRTPRPVVRGTQTALVVGPSGEEIYVDKYGRVKVQFHWDRSGKKNENSSCWVRVAQVWAGKSWGAMAIPRFGQEVIVDFLEGDPDQPIITGSVYNAAQMPPYDLPANHTQTGLKSRSSKGGGSSNYNEIRLEDKKGAEQLLVHAEKEYALEVEADENHTVGGNQTMDVTGDRTVHVLGSFTEQIDGGEERTVTGGVKENVIGDYTQMVTGSFDQTALAGVKITTPAAIQMTAAGGVKMIAPAGVQVIAPGGQTQIDNFWDQTGMKQFTAYAVRVTVSGQVAQSFAQRFAMRGSDTRLTMFKVDTVGVLMDQKGVEVFKKGSSIGQKALCLITAGLYSIM